MKIKWEKQGGDFVAILGSVYLRIRHDGSDFIASFNYPGVCVWGRWRKSIRRAKADAERMACELARGTLAVGRELCELCGLEEE